MYYLFRLVFLVVPLTLSCGMAREKKALIDYLFFQSAGEKDLARARAFKDDLV
jgi:hypothetical protein